MSTTKPTTTLPPEVYQLLVLLTDCNSSLMRPVHAHKDSGSRAIAARRISQRAAEVLALCQMPEQPAPKNP